MNVQTLADKLNASPWRGCIAETGIGMPFSAQYLMIPGASSTILAVSNDYGNLSRVAGRAVSLERVRQIAALKLDVARTHLDKTPYNASKAFGLAISGAHYDDKQSHAWVYLATDDGDWWFHTYFDTGMGRALVADRLKDVVTLFLLQAFFNDVSWAEWCQEIDQVGIDVLYGPGIGDVERMMMLSDKNPLAVRNGVFCRTVDVVRDHAHIYPGSFNPPTNAHLDVGEEFQCLFEITRSHCFKNASSIENVLHRVRMLNAVGQPVLITDLPMYVDKYQYLKNVTEEVNFVMGVDAWNNMIARHQYVSDNWLGEQMPNVSFTVFGREGHEMQCNKVSESLKFTRHRNSHKWSSTHVRESDEPHMHDALPPIVAEYIKNYGLYLDGRN